MKNNLTEEFIRLAKIDSISGEEEEIKQYILDRYSDKKNTFQEDEFGNLFIARKDAKLVLTAHLDTVEPGRGIQPNVKDGKIISSGNTIVGGDNKAGLTVMLLLLKNLPQTVLDKTEFLFTTQEEIGLQGAKHFDYGRLSSKNGISLDKSGYKFGSYLQIGSKAAIKFEMKLSGEARHSSRPDNTLNPLALFIDVFNENGIGKLSKETTLNIGNISGFQQENSTPDNLTVKGDIRAESMQDIVSTIANIKQLAEENNSKVKVQLKKDVVTNGYLIRKDNTLVKKLSSLIALEGHTVDLVKYGSISDANILNENGINTVTLSCGVYHPHQKNEYVFQEDLLNAYEFLFKFLQKA